MKNHTAVGWLVDQLVSSGHLSPEAIYYCRKQLREAEQLEKENTAKYIRNAYNAGYTDKAINHINDVDIYTNEVMYSLYEL